ncbi:chemotaxis protein [Peribacillus sp. SCS-37]|uniref:chemotaxis protein n=1 Tax=Paraperibacillus esterisolvens TaxID=3115296 RepID=UPI003905AB8F
MDSNKGILLESGTNEIEVVEFGIGAIKFGINVIKVKEIIKPVSVTPIPRSHRHVEGVIELRGEVLPIIDVAVALGLPPSQTPHDDKFIVAEFNMQKTVFHVHSVTQIHRLSWEAIEKPTGLMQGLESQIVGMVNLEGNMLMLLDFEKMIVDINPDSGIHAGRLKHVEARDRSDKKVIVAEDSALLRKLIEGTLLEAGIQQVKFFENGSDTLAYLEALEKEGKKVEAEVDLLITDIEMPKMDGLHLTRRIKTSEAFKQLPVIIFSSLITEDLRHKGKMVGADAQVSKPEIGRLIEYMDELIH